MISRIHKKMYVIRVVQQQLMMKVVKIQLKMIKKDIYITHGNQQKLMMINIPNFSTNKRNPITRKHIMQIKLNILCQIQANQEMVCKIIKIKSLLVLTRHKSFKMNKTFIVNCMYNLMEIEQSLKIKILIIKIKKLSTTKMITKRLPKIYLKTFH